MNIRGISKNLIFFDLTYNPLLLGEDMEGF
jgi:hypothetical protein